MNSELQLIYQTLEAVGVSRRDQMRPGDFDLHSCLVTEESEALTALAAQGGTGWAWFANAPGCTLIAPGASLDPTLGPLECAERVSADSRTSVSLVLEGHQWRITTATRNEHSQHEGLSFIVAHSFLQRGATGKPPTLHYEVLWRSSASGGALRPVASRFISLDASAKPNS